MITGYPSIDKPWEKYFTDNDRNIEIPKCTVYQNIYEKNKEYLYDTAIIYYGNHINYNKLFKYTEDSAKALRKIGIKRGDCVTLCTAAVPEAIYLVLACSRVGAIANFINPMFSTQQMIDRINETGAEWIFILDAMYSYIEKALPETCIKHVVIIPATNSIPVLLSKLLYFKSDAKRILKQKENQQKEFLHWSRFVDKGYDYVGEIDVEYQPDTPAVMVYSSGTTGASKGILLTNDGMNATIANYQTDNFTRWYDRKSTMLQMIPIWFSTGIVLSLLMPLTNGATVIPEPKFSKETFVDDILKYRPSICLTATSLWIHVMESEKTKNADLSHFTLPFTGGEKVLALDEVRLNDFLKNHGCDKPLYKGYGMCELGSTVATHVESEMYTPKLGGTGYPMLNAMVAAFDMTTNQELKYGERGEIRVCSPGRMKGYYKNPEATKEFFKTDENGNIWGCTGDIGYIDEDGEVFILGRATDCYKRENGDTVYLFDIEEEIFEEPLVNQCKVVDIKEDEKTKLVAHIVFKDGTTEPERIVKRIDEYLKTKLSDYMTPSYYKIRSSMPVHSNGKRDVEALRNDKEGLLRME